MSKFRTESMETLDTVQREGRERLYPSLTNPSWLVLRKRREIFRTWLSRLNGAELDVLDVGGRLQPYRAILEKRIRRYVAVDVRATPLVSVVSRGEQMPLASDHFDLVICTQVLQYVADPAAVIAEIHRVLKPGGCVWMSAPAVGLQDSGEECWRFLPAGLRRLMVGFRELEVVPEGGSIAGFFRTMNVCFNVFVRYAPLRHAFQWTLCPLLNLSGEALEFLAGSDNQQFTPNYSVWARK